MARSHLYRTLFDATTSKILLGASVSVWLNGTTTPVSQTLFKGPTGTDAWPNPFVASTGVIDFYLDLPETVAINVAFGSAVTLYSNVSVDPTAEEITRTLSPLTLTNAPGLDQVPTGTDGADAQWSSLASVTGGLPVGGTTGQILAKNSGTDFDAIWENAGGGGGVVTGVINSGTAVAIQSTANNPSSSTAADDTAVVIGAGATGLYQGVAIGNGSVGEFHSVAIGLNALANGTGAVAIGAATSVESLADNTIAIGNGAASVYPGVGAQPTDAVAIGSSSQANGKETVAIGSGSLASGDHSIVIGKSSSAIGGRADNVVLGYNAHTSSVGTIVIGRAATIGLSADQGIAIGYGATIANSSTFATAIGYNAVAADRSNAIGAVAFTVGPENNVIGNNSTAGKDATHGGAVAFGNNVNATGQFSSAFGYGSSASGNYGIAIGANTIANLQSVTVGGGSMGAAHDDVSIGVNSGAGIYGTAIGAGTTASGTGSVAIGVDSTGLAASTSTANEFVLGTAAHTVRVKGVPQFDRSQSGVGASGTATALPAQPVKYLQIKDSAGTLYVFPVYNP